MNDYFEAATHTLLLERNELLRIAAQRLIDDKAHGRKVDPEAYQWAKGIVSRFKPLGRAVSTGEQ
jgi:hypothetical protein